MPVVSSNGVVGHVISVTNTTAKVQPIVDPASSISGIMSISRDNIIVKGELGSNELRGTYISTDADLVLNDDVEQPYICESCKSKQEMIESLADKSYKEYTKYYCISITKTAFFNYP